MRVSIAGMAERRDVVVVGAGITGLAAAFWLARAGRRVVVIEASERLGGAIETVHRTTPAGLWIFETGPNTVLGGRAEVAELIAAAELDGERIEASSDAPRRYIWRQGRLIPLPGAPPALLATPLLSARGKLRLLREPWIGRGPDGGEESIAGFTRRRLGPEALAAAVAPFVSGVWAGDPERLAVRWAMPLLETLEREHGSLLRGLLARRKRGGDGGRVPLVSFRDGLATLPHRLGEAIVAAGGTVVTDTPAREVVRVEGAWRVETDGGEIYVAPHLVLAVPAAAAGQLLSPASGGRSDLLAALPHAPVVVASYGFRRQDVAHPLDGFGFLVARDGSPTGIPGDAPRILGCLFPSTIFPGRAPAGHVILTAIAGGRLDPDVVELDEREGGALDATILGDLDRVLGLSGQPVVRHVRRWHPGIPQYELGHERFVQLAGELERDLPGLQLAGSATGGVSVPDRIARGRAAACAILGDC